MVVTKPLIPIPMYIVYVVLKGSIRFRLTIDVLENQHSDEIKVYCAPLLNKVYACNPIVLKVYFKYSTLHNNYVIYRYCFLQDIKYYRNSCLLRLGVKNVFNEFATQRLISHSQQIELQLTTGTGYTIARVTFTIVHVSGKNSFN